MCADFRPTALDRAMADDRIVALFGPVPGLTVERVRAGAAAVLAAAPASRLGVVPRADSRRWATRAALPDDAVTEIPAVTDLSALGTWVRRTSDPVQPIRAVVAGEYLAVDLSHGVGDGVFAASVLLSLSFGADDPGLAAMITRDLPRAAAWTALRRAVLRTPTNLRRVLALRKEHGAAPAPAGTAGPAPGDWRATTELVVTQTDATRLSALRAWGEQHAPGASAAGLSAMLYSAALRQAGIVLDPRLHFLADCRRYLPEAQRPGHGNFAVALPIAVDGGGLDAVAATDAMRAATGSGWPALTLATAEAKALLPRHGGAPGHDPAPQIHYTAGGAPIARLAVSDMGTLPQSAPARAAAGTDEMAMTAYMDPAGPDAITVFVCRSGSIRYVSASFYAAVFDAETVHAALARAADDPVAVLDREVGR